MKQFDSRNNTRYKKNGKIVIILDDERENEGDMIVAAGFTNVENISFDEIRMWNYLYTNLS